MRKVLCLIVLTGIILFISSIFLNVDSSMRILLFLMAQVEIVFVLSYFCFSCSLFGLNHPAKIVLALGSTVLFLVLGLNYFTSDYGNSDYYKPIHPIIIKNQQLLKVYSTFDDCCLKRNDGQVYDIKQNTISVIYFKRDLRDGMRCFKVNINHKSIGFIESIDSLPDPIGDEHGLFKKAYWLF